MRCLYFKQNSGRPTHIKCTRKCVHNFEQQVANVTSQCDGSTNHLRITDGQMIDAK